MKAKTKALVTGALLTALIVICVWGLAGPGAALLAAACLVFFK